MMFDVYCISQILAGKKDITRRMPNGKRPAVPGHIHKLKVDRTKNTYGLILIEDCRIEKLSQLTDEEARREGFNDKEHYMNYFRHLNGDVADDELVWKIKFELL